MRDQLFIICWKHGQELALFLGDSLAIEPCRISSSLLVGNTAGPWHIWMVITWQLTHEGLALHYSWLNMAGFISYEFNYLEICTSTPPLPPKPRASIHLIGVCVWYRAVARFENGGKGRNGGGGGGGGGATTSPLFPPSFSARFAL